MMRFLRFFLLSAVSMGGSCKPISPKEAVHFESKSSNSGLQMRGTKSFTELRLGDARQPVHNATNDIRIDFGFDIVEGPMFDAISLTSNGIDGSGSPTTTKMMLRPQLSGHHLYVWYTALQENSEYTLNIPANAVLKEGASTSGEATIVFSTSDIKPVRASKSDADKLRAILAGVPGVESLMEPAQTSQAKVPLFELGQPPSSSGSLSAAGTPSAAFLARGSGLLFRFYWNRMTNGDWDSAIFGCACSEQTIQQLVQTFYTQHNEFFGSANTPAYSYTTNPTNGAYRIKFIRPAQAAGEEFSASVFAAFIVARDILAVSTSYQDRMRRAHDWIVNNVTYDGRYSTKSEPPQSHHAFGALVNKVAVCQGYAGAMNLLNFFLGIESLTVIGEGKQGGSYTSKKNHMWNKIISPGRGNEFRFIDATWDDPTGGVPNLDYYDVTAAKLASDHQWPDAYSNDLSAYYSLFNGSDVSYVQNSRKWNYDEPLKKHAEITVLGPSDFPGVNENTFRKETLGPGQGLTSDFGYNKNLFRKDASCQFQAVMQPDGNFVVTNVQSKQALWSTRTSTPGSRLSWFDTGNALVYGPGGKALWASGTSVVVQPPTVVTMTMLADGRLGVKNLHESADKFRWLNPNRDSKCVDSKYPFGQSMSCRNPPCLDVDHGGWTFVNYGMSESSNTGSGGLNLVAPPPIPVGSSDPGITNVDAITSTIPINRFLLSRKQLDVKGVGARCNFTAKIIDNGNFVIYRGEWPPTFVPVWSSKTAGNPGGKLAMQSDGNLVFYRANGTAAWSSSTGGKGGVKAVLRGTGRLEILKSNGSLVWASNNPVAGCRN
jgi:hypothetical protein